MYHTPLCPLFSPAYAFTSLHYLKHKGISRHPLSSPLPLYFSLCSARLSSALLISSLNFPQLSYLLTILSSSCLIFSFVHPTCSSLFSPLNSPLFAWLHFSSSFFYLVSFLPSFPYISIHPFLPPPPLLPISPPLTTTVHPLMIAERISFDMKTKG